MANNHRNSKSLPDALLTPEWGPIKEVSIGPISIRSPKGRWDELAAELLLRLEKTPLPHALEIPFADKKIARAAAYSIRKYLGKRRGKNAVGISVRDANLYVFRGSEWNKYEEKAYED